MALTSQSAIAAAFPGQRNRFQKTLGSNALWINQWISLWAMTGIPLPGIAPGSQNGVVPTKATAGALFNFTNPGGSNILYILNAILRGIGQGATLVIYDRLLAASGFSNTATPGSPTVVTRTAPTGGGLFKNELWLENYSTPTTPRTVTLTYTDQDNNSGNVSGSVNLPATPSAMVQLPLAAGDSGVKSVQQITCSGATGGDFGFTILRPLATLSVDATRPADIQSWDQLGMPDVPADACLAMMLMSSVAAPGVLQGGVILGEG